MWCLLDFYFRKELHCSCSFKVIQFLSFLLSLSDAIIMPVTQSCFVILQAFDQTEEVSLVSAIDYTDAVHNFILSQKLPSLLGKFPEVRTYY